MSVRYLTRHAETAGTTVSVTFPTLTPARDSSFLNNHTRILEVALNAAGSLESLPVYLVKYRADRMDFGRLKKLFSFVHCILKRFVSPVENLSYRTSQRSSGIVDTVNSKQENLELYASRYADRDQNIMVTAVSSTLLSTSWLLP